MTLFLILACLLIFALGFIILVKSTKEEISKLRGSLESTQTQVSASLLENTRDITTRLERASYIIGELKKETGAFNEIGRSMKDLQDYLRSPKLRGNIGEAVLSDLISQIFPKSTYFFQYSFKSGERVDAIIKTDAGLLPIDSKFPLDNFQKMYSTTISTEVNAYKRAFVKDLKNHIKTIADKYIVPAEGTLDFALMYVPSESVYYETVMQEDIMDYSRSLRVYPVSPGTLYAALQTILLSYEGKKIESRAQEVFTLLRGIQKEYSTTLDTFSVLGTHLTNAYNKYGEVQSKVNSLGQKITNIKSISTPTTNQQLP